MRSPERAYWRLTSLERFDGRIWSSSGTLRRGGRRPPRGRAAPTSPPRRSSRPSPSRPWPPSGCPAAYEPRAAVGRRTPSVRYDEDSSTLIVDNDVPNSDGLTYEVHLGVPRLDAGRPGRARRRGPGRDPRPLPRRCPSDFSPRVRHARRGRSPPARPTRRRRRCALQDHLRTVRPTPSTRRPGTATTPSSGFLFEHQGRVLRAVRRRLRRHGPLASASRPGSRSASPRATTTRRTRPVPRARASTPTPGPRCSSPGPAGWPSSPRPAGACPTPRPTPACPSSRPRRATRRGPVTAPPTTAPRTDDPIRRPEHHVRDPDQDVNAGGSARTTSTSPMPLPVRLRRSSRCAHRAPGGRWRRGRLPRRSSRLGLLLWRPPAPSPGHHARRADRAGLAGVGRGGSRRRVPAAAERHLRRAGPPPGRPRPRRARRRPSRSPLASRRRSYSADGADDDAAAARSWQAADEIGAAARAATSWRPAGAPVARPTDAGCRLAPRPHRAPSTQITLTARGDLEQRAGARGERRPRLSPRGRYSSSALRKRSRMRPRAPPMASRKPGGLDRAGDLLQAGLAELAEVALEVQGAAEHHQEAAEGEQVARGQRGDQEARRRRRSPTPDHFMRRTVWV